MWGRTISFELTLPHGVAEPRKQGALWERHIQEWSNPNPNSLLRGRVRSARVSHSSVCPVSNLGRPRQPPHHLPPTSTGTRPAPGVGMRIALTLYALLVVVLVAAPTFLRAWLVAMGKWPRGEGPFVALWTYAFQHPGHVFAALTAGFVAFLPVYRYALILAGRVKGWFAPGQLKAETHDFPHREARLAKELARRPPGTIFVGLHAEKRAHLPGWRHRPVYLSDADRSTHRHVLGRTGSGKTTSVLWPQILQDALDGKGVVLIDAKGSDENIRTFKTIAAVAGRQADLKVFSLPAWNEPSLFSHAYNLVWVTPRSPGNRGGDAVAMAERVLAILPLGDNVYFNTQAQLAFTNLCLLLHGLVDARGHGVPFNLEDIAICLRGVGPARENDPNAAALAWVLEKSVERGAAEALRNQLDRLGGKANETLSGLAGALERFLSPLVNAYAPDVVFEDALEKNQLLYAQLPTNLFKLQAPAVARAMLMDIQQAGALRQVFRRQRNQTPFSVVIDEFASFADLHIIESLNKLRDAHLLYTLSHQSLADLELVSKEFAQAVWDNTLTKDVLAQDNPELCDRIAKSLGTWQHVERTVRIAAGPLLTEGMPGDASARMVESYRLHPNAIKALPRFGQGFLLGTAQRRGWFGTTPTAGPSALSYPRLPEGLLEGMDYPLVRNDQTRARGLHLYKRFVEPALRGGGAKPTAAAAPAAAPADAPAPTRAPAAPAAAAPAAARPAGPPPAAPPPAAPPAARPAAPRAAPAEAPAPPEAPRAPVPAPAPVRARRIRPVAAPVPEPEAVSVARPVSQRTLTWDPVRRLHARRRRGSDEPPSQ